ncbi:MAG: hypothetical protein PHG66_00340 [Candidatus Colwellbacteria bacterium]|nr:hypothetical protein [Candidatus Colwellbacteria bacterium]
MIDVVPIRFPQLVDNPNQYAIIHILDTDPQILNRKAGIDHEGEDFEEIQEEGPDDYASYLLQVIANSEDPDIDEDDYLGQVTFDGDSDEKAQRLITLYHNIKPLL